MKVIVLEEAEKALAEQMAYEARMEYGGRQKAEDYLLIAKAYFQNCPIIEAEPVKRGRWHHGECSCCGYDWGKDTPFASVPNYCPVCGSRMEDKE